LHIIKEFYLVKKTIFPFSQKIMAHNDNIKCMIIIFYIINICICVIFYDIISIGERIEQINIKNYKISVKKRQNRRGMQKRKWYRNANKRFSPQ